MKTLDDAAVFLSGGTPKKGTPEYWGGDIPWFSASNMDKKFLADTDIRITESGLNAGSKIAPKGSTLLLVRGSGLFNFIPICFADKDVAFNQDVKAICAKGHVDPTFLHFWIESLRETLKNNLDVTGIGAGKFDLNFLKSLPFPEMDKTEQIEIGKFAESFDRKIELNRQMNATLEAMARALFKDWFVDFGPTKAKQASQPPYLAAELWDLFPDRLDPDTGLPEGWEESTIGKNFDLTMGQSPPGDTYNEKGDGLPFYQGRTDFGFRYPTLRKYCNAPTRIAEKEDTLVSVRAPVGDINMAWEKCCIGRGVSALRHNSGSRSYTYYSLLKIQSDLQSYEDTGTVFGSINKKQFEKLKVIKPTKTCIQTFEDAAFPLDELIKNNTTEIVTLSNLRDTLLPKLMSGEIRLKEAEDKIAETVS